MNLHPMRALSIHGFFALLFSVITASAQMVIVSEIMYNPNGDAPEYIEIENTTATPYDFALWEISGGINYTFPDFNKLDTDASFLRNKERLIVSSVAPDELRAAYPSIPADVRIFGPWEGELDADGNRTGGFLSNSGERLTIKDKNGSLYSSVSYSDLAPWSAAADGGGHSLHMINRYNRVDDFRNWRASVNVGGSPGQAEPADTNPDVRLSEVWFDAVGTLVWVELYNPTASAITLSQATIRTIGDLSGLSAEDVAKVRAEITGTIPAGGYYSVDVNLEADDDTALFLAHSNGNVLDSNRFSDARTESSYQVYPAGSGEWYGVAEASRDAANDPPRNTDIVINEIMFDPIGGGDGEFIELYNKGTETVDLRGWEIQGYSFPAGIQLAAGDYIVVVSDLKWFKSVYGDDVNAVGDFSGRLSNLGELIRLVDADNNLADVVDYGVGGDWPTLADDLGASMELVHPDMDNNRASAWRDSDESSKSQFREYTIKKEWNRAGTFLGGNTNDQELHFHLVGDGYVILEDVDLHKPTSIFNPNADNIIENVDQESPNERSSEGWVMQGTHAQSFLDANQLHIISDGRGDNRANRVEIDINLSGSSSDLELTFKARWRWGKSRLIAQTVDHGWSHEFLIDVPQDLGTPGAVNTANSAVPFPQVDDFMHSPAVPSASDDVLITARVDSINPLTKVNVRYTEDSAGGNDESIFNKWSEAAMNDSGTGGDAVAGDGIYSGLITDMGEDGNVVVFYVNAEDDQGNTYDLPKQGIENPAIYVVDNDKRTSDLRVQRIIMSEYHLDQFGDRPQAKFDYKYPYPSNHYKPCTIIMDEEHVFYGAIARSAGSPWHEGERPNLALKGKWKMPKSTAFRGRIKSTWDQDPQAGDRMHNDRVARYWMYVLGHPVSDNEFIQVVVNAGATQLREAVEAPSDNGFLDRHWENGSQGQMFRIDDEWQFTDRFDRSPRDARWDTKEPNFDRAGRYHSEWMLRSREEEYDYDPIISLFKMTTENDFSQAQAERLIHTEQMAINMAVRGYLGDWDTFSVRRGKNGFQYRRATDGKWMFIHWDSDLGFQGTGEQFLAGNGTAFRNWHSKPYVRRVYNYYLTEMLETLTSGSARLEAFFQAEEDSSSRYTVRKSKYDNWNSGRKNNTKNEIGSENMGAGFAITTSGGNDFETEEDFLTLEGTAGSDVYHVNIKDYPEHYPTPKLEWTSEVDWRLSGIVLAEGENTIEIGATSHTGRTLGSLFSPRKDSVVVTKTTAASPMIDIDTNPGSLNVGVSELLVLDASDSFAPDGSALSFDWSGPTETNYALSPRPGNSGVADASFVQPGLYMFTLKATDAAGNSTTIDRETAVYGAGGFSNFNGDLDDFWSLERLEQRTPSLQSGSYTMNDREGYLTMAVTRDTGEKPLTGTAYPWMHRSLPAESDWALHGQLRLESLQFGRFQTGLLAKTTAGAAETHYAVGMLDGDHLAAIEIAASGEVSILKMLPWEEGDATVRLRRAGDQLNFEYREQKVWESLHMESLAADTVAVQGGPFIATDEAHNMRVSFDYVMLVDPGTVSSLQKDLRVTEIMYNPSGGQDLEYLEIQNVGTQALDLSGANFTAGITYTFPENTQIAAGGVLVLAKDPEAFTATYGADIDLAGGGYDGQLANGGETLTLVDSEERLILSITYGDGGDWPEEADGRGSSIELVDANEPINSPINWVASAEGGSPGEVNLGGNEPQPGDLDGDGIADAWETQYGLDPADASDATLDNDGDGWSALAEYLANTNPNDNSDLLLLDFQSLSETEASFTFEAAADRTYVLESSAIMTGAWTTMTTFPAEGAARSVTSTQAVSADDKRFYRLRVSP